MSVFASCTPSDAGDRGEDDTAHARAHDILKKSCWFPIGSDKSGRIFQGWDSRPWWRGGRSGREVCALGNGALGGPPTRYHALHGAEHRGSPTRPRGSSGDMPACPRRGRPARRRQTDVAKPAENAKQHDRGTSLVGDAGKAVRQCQQQSLLNGMKMW